MIDATFRQQKVKQEQQKLQSAPLKTASNVTTQVTNDGAALSRGKDGQTMQEEGGVAICSTQN